jgi:hypothetical protein
MNPNSAMHRTFLTAALFAAMTPVLAAQNPAANEKALQKQIDTLRDQLVADRAKLLEDVKVNGVTLDPKAVMRECVYLTGGKLVESKVADFFILEEIEKQVAAGHKPEEYMVSDDDVTKELDTMRSEFDVKNPGVDFWEAVRSQYGLSKDTFLQQRKQSVRFDRVFFPGSPKDWPTITREAIIANTQGQDGQKFLEQLEKTADGKDEHGNPKKLPEFWVNMMRQFVQKGLRNWSDIRYASNGIPADVVLTVNGHDWRTDEAFAYVKEGLYVQDLERAMQEVVVREALRQELQKEGCYVSDQDFQKRYDEYRQPYDSTPFSVEVIATRFKGYPCLEAFRSRWRLITSFEDLLKKHGELTDENLQKHADKYAAFFADGQVNLDLVSFLARDPRSGAWVPDGMAKAKARCQAVFADLASGKLKFEDALDKKGEYFANDENKGRLGLKPLNQVKQQFRESEFTQLLDGYSVSSYLFYEAEVGKSVGPIPGPDGWYIVRVNSRTPPKKKIDVKVDRDKGLAKEDFVNTRFMEWAGDVIKKAKIE